MNQKSTTFGFRMLLLRIYAVEFYPLPALDSLVHSKTLLVLNGAPEADSDSDPNDPVWRITEYPS